MALSGEFTPALLGQTKEAMESFLRDPERLATAESLLATPPAELTKPQRQCLEIFVRTFKCYQMPAGPATGARARAWRVPTAQKSGALPCHHSL